MQVPQLHRNGTQSHQHLRLSRRTAETVHQVQQQDPLHAETPVVQTTPLRHARYARNYPDNPESFFGVESAMTMDGIKDPYMRASIIEYIQFMRLTDPLANKPKSYMKY